VRAVTTRGFWALVALIAVAAAAFAGTGLATTAARPGNPEAGRKIFKEFCAQCHNFRATQSHASAAMIKNGHAGSDLDVLKPSYSRTVTAVVQGEGGLAAEYFLRRLTFQQIYDVASFVATYAGKPAPKKVSATISK
jgi:mono/diheme cytochrome c family protein